MSTIEQRKLLIPCRSYTNTRSAYYTLNVRKDKEIFYLYSLYIINDNLQSIMFKVDYIFDSNVNSKIKYKKKNVHDVFHYACIRINSI